MNRQAGKAGYGSKGNLQGERTGRRQRLRRDAPRFRLAPAMQALVLALSAGPALAAGPAFGPGWFSDKRATQAQTAATGRLP
ncbi:hypothetical protein, partial [Achromobacter deleyi]